MNLTVRAVGLHDSGQVTLEREDFHTLSIDYNVKGTDGIYTRRVTE